MLSRKQIKFIKSLAKKKHRQQAGYFVAEGEKTIRELINSTFKLHHVYTTASFGLSASIETLVSENDLHKISFLKTPNLALAVFKIPDKIPALDSGLIVALDDVRDPGNLGTIIRLCDWFGVSQLICSSQTVDCFNPKVVQASMGSITRVPIVYTDLIQFLNNASQPVYGTFMDGESVYAKELPNQAILVMGNEANGISKSVANLTTEGLSIPRFGNKQVTESLNVATATAVLLSEFRRSN